MMTARVPDGGWGWMVVFGGAIHSFIGGGLVRSFSLIFESIRLRYGCSASAAAWVYAINVTTALMTGPVSAMLVSRFGARPVVIVGGILVTTGVIAMACVNSLALTYLTFGLIAGFGNGLVQLPKLIAVSYWFERRRGTATSLALMADGFGSLALSPFFVFCFAYYGYQGTLLILAGFTLQYCISGALYRKPYPKEIVDSAEKVREDSSRQITDEDLETAGKTPSLSVQRDIEDTDIIHGSVEDIYLGQYFLRRKSKSLTQLDFGDVNNTHSTQEKSVGLAPWRSHGNLIWNGKLPQQLDTVLPSYEPCGSLNSMAYKETDVTVPLGRETAEDEEEEQKEISCGDKCAQYLDHRLLKNPRYLAFSAMMASGSLCFSMVNTHFAGLAKEHEHSAATIAALLGVMGIVNTTVKFLSGLLFDWQPIKRRRSHVFSFIGISMGLTLVTAPWSYDVTSFYIVWLLYMSMAAILGTQESLILSDIVSRSSFASAIGMSRFFRGMGVLVGPTFGGYLKDSTGIYMYTFIFGGTTILLTSALFEVIRHWSVWTFIFAKLFRKSKNPKILITQASDTQSKSERKNARVA